MVDTTNSIGGPGGSEQLDPDECLAPGILPEGCDFPVKRKGEPVPCDNGEAYIFPVELGNGSFELVRYSAFGTKRLLVHERVRWAINHSLEMPSIGRGTHSWELNVWLKDARGQYLAKVYTKEGPGFFDHIIRIPY